MTKAQPKPVRKAPVDPEESLDEAPEAESAEESAEETASPERDRPRAVPAGDAPAEPDQPSARSGKSRNKQKEEEAAASAEVGQPDDDESAGEDELAIGHAGAAPRLDHIGRRSAARSAFQARAARQVELNVDDDDEDDATFGPKLAAWLQEYRARQAANAQGGKRPSPVKMLPATHAEANPALPASAAPRAHATAAANADPLAPPWADKAQVAFAEMLARNEAGPPPDWVAAGHQQQREVPKRRGSRWLLAASFVLLMAGTATVAFVAAARNAGVEPSLDVMLAAFGGQPDANVAEAAPVPAHVPQREPIDTEAAPVRATVEIVPTRVVDAIGEPVGTSPASAQLATTRPAGEAVPAPPAPAPEPPRRSVLILPTEPIASDAGAVDHPRRGTIVRPESTRVAEAAIATADEPRAPAVAETPEVAEAPAVAEAPEVAEPPAIPPEPVSAEGTPAAEPQAREVRVASLDPTIDLLTVPGADGSSEKTEDTPSLDAMNRRAYALLQTGDVMSARMLYEMSARSGDAEAAIGAGITYDPVHFERLGVRGVEPDPEMAIAWYNSALGNGEKGALDAIERLEAWMRSR